MKTAVVYARYSSDNQREESITAQLRAIREYAKKNDTSLVKEYIDEAKSATNDDRPNFLQMIHDITTEIYSVDFVFVHKLDRFSRNRYDSAIYRHKLQLKNVKLLAVAQPLDDSPEAALMEGILESMNEFYSKNLGREVMKGMAETALQGKHTGGIPPLGYDVDKVTKKYVINQGEAETVRLIFKLAADGEGYGAIIKKLNDRGLKTKVDKPFGKNSIHEILRNEKYTGTYIFNRATGKKANGKRNNHAIKDDEKIIKIPNAFPAIIEKEQFEEVHLMMESKKTGPRQSENTLYILTGKVFCGECGAAMVGHSHTGGRNKEKYYQYECNQKIRTKTCDNKDIRKEVIENHVLDTIEDIFNPERFEELATKLEARYVEKRQEYTSDVDHIEHNISDIATKMNRLFDAIESGNMESAVAGPRLNSLAKEKEQLEATLSELNINQKIALTHDQIINYLKMNQQILDNRSDLLACKRLIDVYISRVTVWKEDIEVTLNPIPDAHNTGGGGADITVCASKKNLYLVAKRKGI
jgi:site-specific DNA recombinase